MSETTGDKVRVGKVTVSLAEAEGWVRRYTDESRNVSHPSPYAYPAYDRYESAGNDPQRLSDADLLAPGLLNVPVKVRSYYDLQRVRPMLEEGLAHRALAIPLADVEDDSTISEMVGPLYAVLDEVETSPWNVKATTLSKILHRKRPQSLVLHDKWVLACYLGDGGPVPRATERSWAEYMTTITLAIRHDLRTQAAAFERLDAAAGIPGELTPVRLLDILAWTSQGRAPSEAAAVATDS